MNPPRYKLNRLAETVGGTLEGSPELEISGVAGLEFAGASDASWITSPKFEKYLATSKAGVVLVPRSLEVSGRPVIRCENVERSVAALLGAFAQPVSEPDPGIHATAVIHETASIGKDARVGPHVVIDAHASIGERCFIHAGVFIGRNTAIGNDCVIWPNAVVRDRCTVGHRVIIHSCAVIGTDGFGFFFDKGRHNRISQVGGVTIGDDVEIGAGSCVDRAKFGNTVVGSGTKIDNQVQVGHNVRIGEHCVLAGQSGVGGSSVLGDFSVLGGKAGLIDHVTLGRGARVAGGDSTVTQNVPDGETVSGYPAQEHRAAMRQQALMRRLPKLVAQLRELMERVERLESTTHHRS